MYLYILFYSDYGYGYEAPPAPVSATRGRGNIFNFIIELDEKSLIILLCLTLYSCI